MAASGRRSFCCDHHGGGNFVYTYSQAKMGTPFHPTSWSDNFQIGNCYYEQRYYLKATEFYAASLREAREANDREGEASALINIGNTYIQRPAFDGLERGNNVREAVVHYKRALQIFMKDEYPIQYATTQNNLGNAYTYLPAATVDERGENVRKAIECYRAALEIRKKDEYPQDFCITVANIGMSLASIQDTKACHWLREAYALREYLPDQGERLEKLMREVCNSI